MRQFHCIVNGELKKMQTQVFLHDNFNVLSGLSSVESEFCKEEKFGIKLALVSISHLTLL